ncbi:hypothetical protein [Actinoplanes sp. NBRC 101535]|uniref:hypothetical protein n=1 Tax=Actinoplanes sp. NBRC 101535 TaxID=3032196 RepID=UPI0024A167C3|nr:hypothetical protein [Actinoplanes sp. NBRC 101535]GLY04877.1 hypothetical protein Acsp01_52560 [Actinoplanes sp. NBRC 101535]
MTAGTATIPHQPDVGRGPGTLENSPRPGRRLWAHVVRRCLLVPFLVLAPLAAVAPRGDQRFNLYWHGGLFRDDPLRIITHTIATTETYLRLGNFRPLGRMTEKALDLLVYIGMQQLHLPATVLLRLVTLGAAIAVTFAVVLLAESVLTRGRMFTTAPSVVALLLPYAVGAGFVAAGRNSTTTLFGGLYLSTTALVLLVAVAACRLARMRWWHAVFAVTAGGALAVYNEPAYFAVPLATAAVLLRNRFVLGQGARELLRSPGVRFAALLWAGFLPVFGTVRWVIRGYCADGGCYHGSDMVVDPDSLLVLPVRMLAWTPPMSWPAATERAGASWPWGILPVVALLVLAVLALRTLKISPEADRPAGRALAGLALTALVLLTFGALPAALSVEIHTYYPGPALWQQGWRDSAVTAPAGMLLVATLLAFAARTGRRSAGLVLAVLVLAATGTVAANRAYADAAAGWEASQLDNRIALALGAFERGRAGDARRCALLDEALRSQQDQPSKQQRYTDSLNTAAEDLAGVPFCRGNTP